MPRRLLAASASLLVLAACFGGTDPNVTESGEGKPDLSIEFPPTVEPDSQEVATLHSRESWSWRYELSAGLVRAVGSIGSSRCSDRFWR